MEQEYKWQAILADFDAICRAFPHSTFSTTHMLATYYDTAARTLRTQKIGLRLRQENEQSICCMKLRGEAVDGLHVQQEYECAAADIAQGLDGLASHGAPAHVFEALQGQDLLAICATDFTRTSTILIGHDFTAELTFDKGLLISGDNQRPFTEIEMELKSGNFEEFTAFGRAITAQFHLTPQPMSKMSRALLLAT